MWGGKGDRILYVERGNRRDVMEGKGSCVYRVYVCYDEKKHISWVCMCDNRNSSIEYTC